MIYKVLITNNNYTKLGGLKVKNAEILHAACSGDLPLILRDTRRSVKNVPPKRPAATRDGQTQHPRDTRRASLRRNIKAGREICQPPTSKLLQSGLSSIMTKP